MRRTAGVALALAALGLSACGSSGATHRLVVTVEDTTNAYTVSQSGDPFSSGNPGAVVYNGSGAVVGNVGSFTSSANGAGTAYTGVTQVPTERFYRVTIPGVGSVVFSLHQLQANGWHASLTYSRS